ncbi:hypothetical protein VARIO8X_120126 [Burkholderiales bacterium 8X]|nr:hypothetical protein VARIO8X_120126 [Burkholderiales bacterium 8X]
MPPPRLPATLSDYVKGQTFTSAARDGHRRLSRHSTVVGRGFRRGLPGGRSIRAAGGHQGIPSILAGHARHRRTRTPGAAREALSLPSGPQELLRRRPFSRADLACLGRQRAQLLPGERDGLHGDELPGRRDLAGLHRHRPGSQEAEGVSRIDRAIALRRNPSRSAHRAPAQDASPGHQAGQHLRHGRRPRRDDRLRRRARGAFQGRQFHPAHVHARFRGARDVPARFVDGTVDRHLRDRCLHLCLHAGLSAQRRTPAHRKGPARPFAVSPAGHLFGQLDRGGRVVHVARSAFAPAVGLRAAKGAEPGRRAALYEAHRQRKGPALDRQHSLVREEGAPEGSRSDHAAELSGITFLPRQSSISARAAFAASLSQPIIRSS